MGQSPTRWEYLVLPATDEVQLGDLGREGWELVSVTGADADRRLYLKRQVLGFREAVTLEQRGAYYHSAGKCAPSGDETST